MNKPNSQDLLQFALNAAWQAGRITLGHFQSGVRAERKANNTPVTVADREAEQKIRAMIEKYWPDHAIHGEEYDRCPWTLHPSYQ